MDITQPVFVEHLRQLNAALNENLDEIMRKRHHYAWWTVGLLVSLGGMAVSATLHPRLFFPVAIGSFTFCMAGAQYNAGKALGQLKTGKRFLALASALTVSLANLRKESE